MDWIMQPAVLYGISLLGAFSHFLKKKVKGESINEIGGYFKDNFKSTLLALIMTSISYVGYSFLLETSMPADVLTVFSLGYMCDSAFNKFEK